HDGLRVVTSTRAFRRFAFAYGIAFAVLYVIARARGLALFTVYPSLGIVLPGMHRGMSPIPCSISSRPRCGGTAGPPRLRPEHLRSALSPRSLRIAGAEDSGQGGCG